MACLQEGLVPYTIELEVKGDVSIAVWFGMYNMGERLSSKPDVSYCFHTAFAHSGVDRVKVRHLNPGKTLPPMYLEVVVAHHMSLPPKSLICCTRTHSR